jgi:hypothetical protein
MAAKKKGKSGTSDRAIANCVADKLKKCMDDALVEGKSLDRAIGGCRRNLTTFKLLCMGDKKKGSSTGLFAA